mmetsp:Transcript_45302/g.111271  ORF Transcript_45302/g.111271 Transcript_45302/m.111271 type:complete len:398 (-) Transcript_45302:411-1604(-)
MSGRSLSVVVSAAERLPSAVSKAYVKVSLGGCKAVSSSDVAAGVEPKFAFATSLAWGGEQELWVEICERRKLRGDVCIGTAKAQIRHLFASGLFESGLPLFTREGKDAGIVHIRATLSAAATVWVDRATDLRNVEWIGTQDPYVKVFFPSKQMKSLPSTEAGKASTTPEHHNGGKNPVFSHKAELHWDGEPTLFFEVMDKNKRRNDESIASGRFEFSSIQDRRFEGAISLSAPGGGASGALHIRIALDLPAPAAAVPVPAAAVPAPAPVPTVPAQAPAREVIEVVGVLREPTSAGGVAPVEVTGVLQPPQPAPAAVYVQGVLAPQPAQHPVGALQAPHHAPAPGAGCVQGAAQPTAPDLSLAEQQAMLGYAGPAPAVHPAGLPAGAAYPDLPPPGCH